MAIAAHRELKIGGIIDKSLAVLERTVTPALIFFVALTAVNGVKVYVDSGNYEPALNKALTAVGYYDIDKAKDEARRRGYERVSLETGSQDHFAPARRLYARHGFVVSEPFEGYAEDPNSTFMTLDLHG